MKYDYMIVLPKLMEFLVLDPSEGYWIPWATVDLKCLKQVALQVTTSIYGLLSFELDSQESRFIFAYTWLPKEIRVGFLQYLKYSLVGKPCWPDLPKVQFS